MRSDRVKAQLSKYKRPENCGDITKVCVNPEIWTQLSFQKKKTDLQLSNFQQIARKPLFVNIQMTNTLMAGQQVDTKSVLVQTVDSIALLGHMNHNLSQLRRVKIRPALKSEYVSICSSSADHEDSKYLFGDDLPKRLQDAKESSRIGNTMTHNVTRQTGRKQYSEDKGRIFLWKGPTRPTRGKPPAGKKLQNIKNSITEFCAIYSRISAAKMS